MIRLLLKKLAVHDLGEKVRCRKEGAKQTRKQPGRFPIPTPSFPGEYLELRHCRPRGGGRGGTTSHRQQGSAETRPPEATRQEGSPGAQARGPHAIFQCVLLFCPQRPKFSAVCLAVCGKEPDKHSLFSS